jgi:hypothetical protein
MAAPQLWEQGVAVKRQALGIGVGLRYWKAAPPPAGKRRMEPPTVGTVPERMTFTRSLDG